MQRHNRRSVAACCLLAVCFVASCGGTPRNPWPPNALDMLSADPVFSALPGGAKLVQPIKKTAPHYRKPGLDGGGWDGPAVIVRFSSPDPIDSVYGFYGARASGAGWKPTAAGARALTDRWTKTHAGGPSESLSLFDQTDSSGDIFYTLSGSG